MRGCGISISSVRITLDAVEKNIEIDDARAARDQFPAPQLALDSLQRVQQLPRRQRSFRLHDAIQKPRLREKIHRLGFIERRSAKHSHARFGQSVDGAFEIRGAVAEVRAEREIDELAVRHT